MTGATELPRDGSHLTRGEILAIDNTVLAAERTYAAWVRTGLTALAAGVGARALLHGAVPDWLARITGAMLVLFSALAFGAAVWREFSPVVRTPGADFPRIPGPLLIAVNGFLMLVALATVVGLLAS